MIAGNQWQTGNTGTDPSYLVDTYNFPLGWWLFAQMCTGLATGAVPSAANDGCGVMTPAQASSIDVKIDDGKPLSGKVWSYSSGTKTGCLNGGFTDYNISTATNANAYNCQMAYRFF